jgi:hypothetical protein
VTHSIYYMKYQETTFEDYLASNASKSLHPITERTYDKYPPNIEDMHNLVFYGPPGSGKYTQVLRFLKKYSPSDLKYEKRVTVTSNKITGYYKISDVHMEVDMGMLGCNSKCMWHDIFTHVNDMLNAKSLKVGFVVCKNFHEVHNELLDIFYSYMQGTLKKNPVKFILITESVSFIPDNVIGCCEVINIPRPTNAMYSSCVGKRIPSGMNMSCLENIKNIKNSKNIKSDKKVRELVIYNDIYDRICDKIVSHIEPSEIKKWSEFRDNIYDIFTYNIDVHKCVWRILSNVLSSNEALNTTRIMEKTYSFLKFFNNNYRPIYHMEGYFLFLKMEIIKINGLVLT